MSLNAVGPISESKMSDHTRFDWFHVQLVTAILVSAVCVWPVLERDLATGLLLSVTSAVWIGAVVYLHDDSRTVVRKVIAIGAILWPLQQIGQWNTGPAAVIELLGTAAFWIAAVTPPFKYPPELQTTAAERRFIKWFATYMVSTSTIAIFISRPEWFGFAPDVWWITITENRAALDLVVTICTAIDVVAALTFGTLLLRRMRLMTAFDRVTIKPLLVGYGILAIGASLSVAVYGWFSQETSFIVLMSISGASAPAGFFIHEAHRHLQSKSVSDELSDHVSAASPRIEDIEQALRNTFTDPSIAILFWDDELKSYIDTRGAIAFLPDDQNRLTHIVNGDDDAPLAVVITDAYLDRHPDSIQAALRSSKLALENARLQALVRSQLEDVRNSRARIAEAALDERRRIERDLHDGVQQRLLALGTRIGSLRQRVDEGTQHELSALNEDLSATLLSLRELAQGIHPTELRQFGLDTAISNIAETLPLNVYIDIAQSRFSPALEATTYFVICEALTNIVKHAEASDAYVLVNALDGELLATISDNGIGAASFDGGSGIVGLRDRVAAMGGKLTIKSTFSGTTLMTRVPIT